MPTKMWKHVLARDVSPACQELRQYAEAHGLSNQAMADAWGVALITMRRWLTGTRPLSPMALEILRLRTQEPLTPEETDHVSSRE